MEIVEGLAEKGEDDVLGPKAAEGESSLLLLAGSRNGLLSLLGKLHVDLVVARSVVVDVVERAAQDKSLDTSGGVEAAVIGTLLGLGGLLEAEKNSEEDTKESQAVDNRRQGEGVSLDEGDVEWCAGCEPLRERHSRVGEPSTEDGAKNTGDVEAHREDEESPGLVLALDGNFGDHGADDSNETVDGSGKYTPEHGGSEASRESVTKASDASPEGADEQDHLATSVEFGRVGNLAPENGREDLCTSEASGQETSLR